MTDFDRLATLTRLLKEAKAALEPFSDFREVQQYLGGTNPKSGALYAVAAKGKEAEITVENLDRARSVAAEIEKELGKD